MSGLGGAEICSPERRRAGKRNIRAHRCAIPAILEGAKVAFPGAHFVGTPRENVTPVASEFRAVFETPGKGYCFVWHETFGLKGRTAFSPGLFAMFNAETSEALSRE